MRRRYLSGAEEEPQSLDSLLEALSPDELRVLIARLVARDPDLADVIQVQVELLRTRPGSTSAHGTPAKTVDAGLILRAVRSTLHSARGYRAAREVTSEAGDYLDEATQRIEAGDGRGALAILEAITVGLSGGFDIVDDSYGELGMFYDDLGSAWTEAVLTADLTPTERAAWAKKLREWQGEVERYGIVQSFAVAIEATRQGWDDPTLIRAMQGESSPMEFWAGQRPAAEPLAIARIAVLERQGRFEEALNLAAAAYRAGRVAILLVRMDRIEEAVEYAKRELLAVEDALALGRILHERQEIEAALRVGEHGLELAGSVARLGRWLRDIALENGRTDLAIRAATAVLRNDAELDDYIGLQEIAGEGWPQLREQILSGLRRSTGNTHSGTIDIYLYEGLMKDALAAVEQSYDYELTARVVEAAIPTEPLLAIPICHRQAESIMDRGKSNLYDAAVRWLARAKAAYQVAGQSDEWQSYLSELLTTHKSKYRLVPMLRTLERA